MKLQDVMPVESQASVNSDTYLSSLKSTFTDSLIEYLGELARNSSKEMKSCKSLCTYFDYLHQKFYEIISSVDSDKPKYGARHDLIALDTIQLNLMLKNNNYCINWENSFLYPYRVVECDSVMDLLQIWWLSGPGLTKEQKGDKDWGYLAKTETTEKYIASFVCVIGNAIYDGVDPDKFIKQFEKWSEEKIHHILDDNGKTKQRMPVPREVSKFSKNPNVSDVSFVLWDLLWRLVFSTPSFHMDSDELKFTDDFLCKKFLVVKSGRFKNFEEFCDISEYIDYLKDLGFTIDYA